MKFLLYRHQTDAQKKANLCTIYCKIIIDGISLEIGTTKVTIDYNHFDQARSRVLDKDPFYEEKNNIINEDMIRPLYVAYLNLKMNGGKPTAHKIKAIFRNVFQKPIDYLVAYQDFLFQYLNEPKKGGGKRSESTMIPLTNAFNKISGYLNAISRINMKVHEVDEDFFNEYYLFLFRQGHKQSYVAKNLKVLKQSYAWIIKKYKLKDELTNTTIEHEKRNKPHFLTDSQFNRWKNFEFSTQTLQETADLFTVYCRTAFHYQDLAEVIKNPDAFISYGLDGKKWIFKDREKSDVTAYIPFEAFPEIKAIVDKYGGWNKLPLKCNQKLNQWLKICVAEINVGIKHIDRIYPGLSVKHGRCTFCDWWINSLGYSADSLLPLMGRKTDYNLDVYVRPDERSIMAVMKNSSAMAS